MIIEVFKAIILGVVEGVTEFLPISSTGHLILVNEIIHFSEQFTVMFDIVIQLGAILAVVVVFWKRLWPFKKDVPESKRVQSLWIKVLVGVIPAIIAGFFLGSLVEKYLFNPWVVGVSLIVGGIILIWVEKKKHGERIQTTDTLSVRSAFGIGCIQILALIPGISRSGATIVGGLFLGASRVVAVEFSFFLAIPTMIGATGYSFLKHSGFLSGNEYILLLVGFVTAFLVAFLVIRLFMRFIQQHTFISFGYYRIAAGVIVLTVFLIKTL